MLPEESTDSIHRKKPLHFINSLEKGKSWHIATPHSGHPAGASQKHGSPRESNL